MKVLLAIIEPYELGDHLIEATVLASAQIARVDGPRTRLLVAVQEPFRWHDDEYSMLVLWSRGEVDQLDRMQFGRPVVVGGYGVSETTASKGAPWGANSWRGRLAILGDVTLAR